MTNFVTHYFSEKEIQDHFSPELKELIRDQESLHLLGSQGSGLFFFQISKQIRGEKNLGTLLHGRPFHSPLEDLKKLQPHLAQKPRSLTYFLGLCNHFFADTSTHPTVNVLARPDFGHISIGGELGRYFIKKNGRGLNGFRQSKLLAPPYDSKAILATYQDFGATLSDIQASIQDFKQVRKIPQPQGSWQEKILLGLLKVTKLDRFFDSQLVPQVPHPWTGRANQALVDILKSYPQEVTTPTKTIYL